MISFLILVFTVLVLTICGAGFTAHADVIAAGLVASGLLIKAREFHRKIPSQFPALYWLFILGYTAVTLAPLPLALEFLVDQQRQQQNHRVVIALEKAENLGFIEASEAEFALSRNRSGTLKTLLYLIMVGGAWGLAVTLAPVWGRRYLIFLVSLTALIAILGYIGQHVIPQGKTLWWMIPVRFGEPVACFVNRSHFGSFIALMCPSALMVSAYAFERERWGMSLWGIICFALMSIAIVTCYSRGAFFLYLFSVMLTALGSIFHRQRTIGLIVCGLGLIGIIATVTTISGDLKFRLHTIRRVFDNVESQSRVMIWRDVFRLWQDYPVIGVGGNGMKVVFPAYRSLVTIASVDHAESQYLQLLANSGLIGLLMLLVGGGWFTQRLFHYRAQLTKYFMMAAGILTGLLCVLVHAAFDVALTIPLYAFVTFTLAGLGVGLTAQTARNQEFSGKFPHPDQGVKTPNPRVTKPRRSSFSKPLLIWGMAGVGLTIYIGVLFHHEMDQYDRSSYLQDANPAQLCQILISAPTSWETWDQLGKYGFILGTSEGIRFNEFCLSQAADYNPTDWRLWNNLAALRRGMGDGAGAEIADERMRRVIPEDKLRHIEKL